MSTETAHLAAVMALLTAGNASPYTLQQLADLAPAALPTKYCEVYVTERFSEGHRFGGRSDKRAWRVQVRAVAQIEANAQTIRTRVRDALEDKSVTVSGVESTAMLRGASDEPIRPDEGWFSGLSEFVYYC